MENQTLPLRISTWDDGKKYPDLKMDHSLNVSYSRRYTEKTEKKKTDILKNKLAKPYC